jgi:CubicO group peptidase (beta-lactamase class C family)
MDVHLMAREVLWPISGILLPGEAGLLREAQTGRLSEPRSLAYRINRNEAGQSDETTAAGTHLPPEAFGHNGFTGTSVWIDPSAGRLNVLLTNRVHPRVRDEVDMNAIRREFHRRAAAS